MTNDSTLTAQVARILDRLFLLPGRTELYVETKRYPRFLPAESGVGFEQKSWSFNSGEMPRNADIVIPPDTEDVVVTWKGGIDAADAMDEISVMMGAAVLDLAFRRSWDYEVFTRQRETESPQVVVRVFRDFSANAGSD